MKPEDLLKNIMSDAAVKLTEEFDRNFERKAFFDKPWPPRKNTRAKGSLLVVTGKLRRSIRGSASGNSVKFTSALPYAGVHNTGGKFTQAVGAHNKTIKKGKNKGKTYVVKSHSRTISIPQRQFIGNHPKVKDAIEKIANDNIKQFLSDLAKSIKK